MKKLNLEQSQLVANLMRAYADYKFGESNANDWSVEWHGNRVLDIARDLNLVDRELVHVRLDVIAARKRIDRIEYSEVS